MNGKDPRQSSYDAPPRWVTVLFWLVFAAAMGSALVAMALEAKCV